MSSQTDFIAGQGRAAYNRGDYAKALELFNRAIGRSPSVQLLDSRARCHDKLGDLKAAIQDAKKTIQLAGEDPTGYIRAGNVMVKMGKREVALEILTHGLKKVKHVGTSFQLLKKAQSDLMTELSPNNSIDPMTRLPRELAEHVLGYLSFKQLISTSRTSKEWHTFIFRSPSLWRDLDFTFAKRKVRNIFVSRAINSGRSKIKTATLSQMFDVDKACAALARHCALEKLTLINTGLHAPTIVKDLRPLKQLKSLTIGYGTLIHDDHLLQIVKEVAPTLEALRYDSVRPLGPWIEGLVGAKFPNMQIFDLTASVFGIELDLLLEDLHSMMPNLRKLRLHEENRDTPNMHAEMDFQKFKHLTHLDLILEMTTASSIKLPTTITSLAIGVTAPRDKDFLDDVTAFGPLQWDLPLLEELKIGVAEVPFHSIKLLLGDDSSSGETSSARLHTLCAAKSDVKGALTGKFASKDCILRHPRLAELENLSLEGCIDANDDTMFLIAEILPQLRTLNLSETAVTGAGIKAVVKNNCLKKLVLLDCHYLGLDAVSWARGQGVKVEHGMSKQNNGMKKVRW